MSCSEAASARAAALGPAGSGESDTQNLIPLGIAIGLSASIVINLAQNFVARGWAVRVWTTAFAIACASNFVAFSFAPGSILSPLEGAQFVTNLVFNMAIGNRALLDPVGESRGLLNPMRITIYGWKTIFGTAFVVVGVILPVLGGSGVAPAVFDEEAILCFWKKPGTIVYLSVLTGVALLAGVVFRVLRAVRWPEGVQLPPGVKPGDYRYVRSQHQKEIDNLAIRKIWRDNEQHLKAGADEVERYRTAVRLENLDGRWYSLAAYALFATIIGGFAVIQAKVISELIEVLIQEGFDIMARALIWITSVLVAVLFVVWLQLLANAPLIFPQVAAIPTLQGGYIIFASTGPGIFLEELAQLDGTGRLYFWGGMASIAVGIALMIASGPPPAPFYQATFWMGEDHLSRDEKTGLYEVNADSPDLPKNLEHMYDPAENSEDAREASNKLEMFRRQRPERAQANSNALVGAELLPLLSL